MPKHSLEQIKEKITERSKKTRELYLENIFNPKNQPKIESLGCANIAHVTASMPEHLKMPLGSHKRKHFAIITAYNDMLSNLLKITLTGLKKSCKSITLMRASLVGCQRCVMVSRRVMREWN